MTRGGMNIQIFIPPLVVYVFALFFMYKINTLLRRVKDRHREVAQSF